MTLYCPRCQRTDDRWKLAIPALRREDGMVEDVYRHACRELMAVERKAVYSR